MNLSLHTFASATELDQAQATLVAGCLRAGLAERGQAALALSGGRTPAGFFRALSAAPLDWSSIFVTLADERCCEPASPHNNAASLATHLLQGPAAAARFLPLYLADETPPQRNARLAALPAQFDVVVLGMGEDGHTASIFPHSPQREAALYDATGRASLDVIGAAPVRERITLTAARLLATRNLILHITGQRKWQVLGEALQHTDPALPVSHILHAQGPEKHVFWTR
ncbi:6-phosphogluconolactonase [Uliginosibacterium aquaticum]|uniref:6-phosphogluconolactonase n=1 Tax=Uliginosibacterium aquaticum TaxID=2731212 RepID=A0ABX2IM89_9RHOO|nr:6-phosphogluconolactonase [Uliginosibacterium aquaticum]NSL55436.1 6-phosphogluconolactonase [Uliginosibacterium aquaticum]